MWLVNLVAPYCEAFKWEDYIAIMDNDSRFASVIIIPLKRLLFLRLIATSGLKVFPKGLHQRAIVL